MVRRAFDGALAGPANAERDVAALRAGEPLVRVAWFGSACVSIGIGQPPDGPVARAARRAGLPVVVRSSGGTGLLHLPGDLAWSIVLPRASPVVGRDFVSAYDRLGKGAVDALRSLGLDARWSPPFDRSESYCLLGARGRVLTVRGRAIGGAAQHLTTSTLLHHGILNRTIEPGRLAQLFALPSELVAATVTSLEAERVRTAVEAIGHTLLGALGDSVERAISG